MSPAASRSASGEATSNRWLPSPRGTVPTSARGHRTRDRILQAARVVFERDGFLNARIVDIAAAAGVAYGSFYTYFASKQDIFFDIALRAFEDIDHTTATAYQSDRTPHTALRDSIQNYVDAYRRQAAVLALLDEVAPLDRELMHLRNETRARMIERAVEVIVRYQRAGYADPQVDPQCTASALASMVENFAYLWLADGDFTFDDTLVVITLTRIWAQGISLTEHRRPPRRRP